MTESKRINGDYENEGVTIHPGEPVLFAASSGGLTYIRRGVYLGYIVRDGQMIPQISYLGKEFDYENSTWFDSPKIATLTLGRVYSTRHFESRK